MYSRILVPLDGSKRAEAILPHVEQLAHCLDATVVLLQVIEPTPIVADPYDPIPVTPVEETQARRQRIENYLSGIADRLASKQIGVETRTILGPVVDSIIEVAEDAGVDLIAMASHGRSGLSRVFYGSIATGVLQRIDRPLFLIRSREGD